MPKIVSLGVGGPLSALISGLTGYHKDLPFVLLCPLIFFELGLITPFVPVLLPIIYVLYLAHKSSDGVVGMRLRAHSVRLIFTNVIYLIVCAAILFVASMLVEMQSSAYFDSAAHSHELQIATSSQLAYASNVVTIYAVSLAIIVLLITYIFAYVIALSQGFEKPSHCALVAFMKNFPGLAVIVAIMYGVFNIVERYYAHFRLIGIEAMIKGEPYFDPSWPFIILRVYLVYAFMVAFALIMLMAFGLLSNHSAREK